MSSGITIDDYITPIKAILSRRDNREKGLHRFIYRHRKINNRHFYKMSVDETVEKLLDSKWPNKIKGFDPYEWSGSMRVIQEKTRKLLGQIALPKLILFPGFGLFNGRVYKLDGTPVIGCSPDFPGSTGDNLKVLLSHEYAHFIRWSIFGVPPDMSPIYKFIFEEGWATWLSREVMPDIKPRIHFMANLHSRIGMPDPKGGYISWCRKNLGMIANKAKGVLKSKTSDDLGRFFQCQRLESENTPIRVGYYLGYCIIENLSKRMTPREILYYRPSMREISGWLSEFIKGN